MKITSPTLHKRTSAGTIQVWYIECDIANQSYRTNTVKQGSHKIVSDWKKVQAKNIGKSNFISASRQTLIEIAALYEKKKKHGYHSDINKIDEPSYFKPMLAKKYDGFSKLNVGHVYSQPKLDGIRCIVSKDGMFTRRGEEIVSAPHIYKALLKTGIWYTDPSFIYDGELYNHSLQNDFEQILSLVRKTKPTEEDLEKSKNTIQYWVYDCHYGKNDHCFSYRKERLNAASIHSLSPVVQPVQTDICYNERQIDSYYEEYLFFGYEGQIIRVDQVYENKRSNFLLKRKEFEDHEYEILDIIEGVGNRSGMAGAVTCKMSNGTIFNAGIKGGEEFYKKLLQEKNEYIGGEVTVRHFKYTGTGTPKYPVAVAFYKFRRVL